MIGQQGGDCVGLWRTSVPLRLKSYGVPAGALYFHAPGDEALQYYYCTYTDDESTEVNHGDNTVRFYGMGFRMGLQHSRQNFCVWICISRLML